jgi:hypothetical protein
VETDKNAGYFELNVTDEGIDLAALREEILHELPEEMPKPSKRSTDLADQILSFRLAEKTPLEALMFVRNLQETIRQETAR